MATDIGEAVGGNLAQLRKQRGFSLRGLAARLAEVGAPIHTDGVNRIERGKRHVTTRELLALAAVLGVNPNRLLLPFTSEGPVKVPAVGEVPADVVWMWAEGERPLVIPDGDDGTALVDFQTVARPKGIRRYHVGTPAERALWERDFGQQLPEAVREGRVPRNEEEARGHGERQ